MKELSNTASTLPRHIAFIMDGNGRWAKKRGMPREYGHRFGVKAFRTVLEHCDKLGLEATTFYAFSTENWKRPQREVDAILKLMDTYLAECEKKIEEYAFRIVFLGDKSVFDEKRRARMIKLEELTATRRRILNIALNYGGRDEIVNACNRLLSENRACVTTEDFEKVLYTKDSPEVDMIVRTGGDLRISNFLLWQAAYAELYFTDVLWPDFGPADVDAAIAEFSTRKRRFGGV
ncbi:MAG: di-trans,poly-cis-decaprenylcistransferase [Clostridia bacterium]|nr:di-trans,poly-cis-decaprenylcistransferase [Clostridia bacterium]